VPESQILGEMAEMAISDIYPKILSGEITENKIDPVRGREGSQRSSASNGIDAISRPEISITKLARKNPLGFKIKTATMPEMKLPDYKQIAKKIISETTDAEKNTEVTEKEVEDTITDIRKSRAPKIHMADKAEEHIHKEGEEHDNEKEKEEIKQELPEFNDEFVQALGPFKNVVDFKEKLKENIKLEKVNQAKEKTRLKIVEKIIDDLKVEMPEVLIEVELDKILYRMESDITQMGLKFEDYLKHLNKTVPDLRKEFRIDAEKKAKLGLILNKIAEIEKIEADKEQVANEVAKILEHYKDADPERATLHAENVLTNEKVFQFLENQK
jgi:FKBP-type peptidyl-prolyl cis-trans isomerase (trigger factor)